MRPTDSTRALPVGFLVLLGLLLAARAGFALVEQQRIEATRQSSRILPQRTARS
jgi:hypothetical protein